MSIDAVEAAAKLRSFNLIARSQVEGTFPVVARANFLPLLFMPTTIMKCVLFAEILAYTFMVVSILVPVVLAA
jgi:hypothetical protein